jgi:hypothetical protein
MHNRYSTAKLRYIITPVLRSSLDVSILERHPCAPTPTERWSTSLTTPQLSLWYAGIRHPVPITGWAGSSAMKTLQ